MKTEEKTIFDRSVPGRRGYALPACDVSEPEPEAMFPKKLLRETPPELPQVSEVDVVRHYTRLSQENYGVDTGFYPLGSCTMKYSPKVDDDMAALPGFCNVHPLAPEETVQGCLELLWRFEQMLAEITGMERLTFQPAAGAHGELTGMMIIRAWHASRGDAGRTKMLIPDSAHGTNPASATTAGFQMVEIKSDARGNIDLADLRAHLDADTAGLMLTNPNTLGLFDDHILAVADAVHTAGGLLYYDGANANAIVGVCRPGDMGFDVVHLNLHKTFATPHGGGGPGSGPVGVKKNLVPFLPGPLVGCRNGRYFWQQPDDRSIGRVRSFGGNFGVIVRAYTYLCSIGAEGLEEVSRAAVLNANYVRAKLRDCYDVAFDRPCMHEVVLSAARLKAQTGVTANDVAKRLIDFGYHPPTVYFPLIVKEALMVEPTETEGKETLDGFIAAMRRIAREAEESPEQVTGAPHGTPVAHPDETRAARTPVLRWRREDG